jgi:hypothetical protein
MPSSWRFASESKATATTRLLTITCYLKVNERGAKQADVLDRALRGGLSPIRHKGRSGDP